MVVQLGQRNRACIARFLLCVGRLERRGDVLAMDPALMEEMLQYMFKTLVWDTTPECEKGVILSPNMLRVSMNPAYRQSCRHVVSTGFTDDFTVRLSDNGAMHGVSIVCIGFAREGLDFTEIRQVTSHGVYTLVPHVGKLFGTMDRTMPEVYCPLFTRGMVRCVADRLNGTISYHVDGVDRGVAWRGVAPGPLHAVVIFIYPGVSTELIE